MADLKNGEVLNLFVETKTTTKSSSRILSLYFFVLVKGFSASLFFIFTWKYPHSGAKQICSIQLVILVYGYLFSSVFWQLPTRFRHISGTSHTSITYSFYELETVYKVFTYPTENCVENISL